MRKRKQKSKGLGLTEKKASDTSEKSVELHTLISCRLEQKNFGKEGRDEQEGKGTRGCMEA